MNIIDNLFFIYWRKRLVIMSGLCSRAGFVPKRCCKPQGWRLYIGPRCRRRMGLGIKSVKLMMNELEPENDEIRVLPSSQANMYFIGSNFPLQPS